MCKCISKVYNISDLFYVFENLLTICIVYSKSICTEIYVS